MRKTIDIIATSEFHNKKVKIRAEALEDGSYSISVRQYKTLMGACPYSECGCGIAIEDSRGRQLMATPSTSMWGVVPDHYVLEPEPQY